MSKQLNAVEAHEAICTWIASSKTEAQLMTLQLFVTDTFSKRFPAETNPLHKQMISNMLGKIERAMFECTLDLENVHTMD